MFLAALLAIKPQFELKQEKMSQLFDFINLKLHYCKIIKVTEYKRMKLNVLFLKEQVSRYKIMYDINHKVTPVVKKREKHMNL